MKYLLDVNGLVALGFLQHEFHERVASWVHTLTTRGVPELATCSITELGFVRVLAQAPQYGFTIAHARTLLLRLKTGNSLPSRTTCQGEERNSCDVARENTRSIPNPYPKVK